MNQKIVNLRALAILLIVFGHSIIIYDPTFELLNSSVEVPLLASIKHIISFIQLKLFFMLSGFCLFYSCGQRKIWWRSKFCQFSFFVKNKFCRILIPYFVIAFLWMDPIKYVLSIPGYTDPVRFVLEQLYFTNCGHLWFLPCLFLIMIIVRFLVLDNSSVGRVLIIFLCASGLSYFSFYFSNVFQFDNVIYYLPYFVLGFAINAFLNDDLAKLVNGRNRINVVFWSLTVSIALLYITYKITSIGFDWLLSVIILIAFYIVTPGRSNRIISFISDNSFGLYLFHSPLIYITAKYMNDASPVLMVFVNFFVFGCFSLFLSYYLSKTALKFAVGDLQLKKQS